MNDQPQVGRGGRANVWDWSGDGVIERDPTGALDALDRAWAEYWHAAVAGTMSTSAKREALHELREQMGLR